MSAASRASIDVIPATKAAQTVDLEPMNESAVEVVEGSARIARPGGTRFGSLVHALLADVPFGDEGAEALERLAMAHGRILGATGEEVDAARDVVREVLAHPLLQAAGHAAREGLCYREMPITYRLPSGLLVEGYVDLAFRQGASMVVVDFKTDRELDGALEQYRKQVSLYGSAIGQTAALPTKSVLMRV
jgi:ATP-dependent exoDNAse (exonuclease V) beta subunit